MKTIPNPIPTKLSCGRAAATTVLFLLLAAAAPWNAGAAKMIGINFAGTSTAGNMQPGDASGASGVRTTNWNNVNMAGQFTTVTLGPGTAIDNSGNFLSDFTATLYPNIFSPGSGASATATNENKLFGFTPDTQPGNENRLNLQNVPYTNYFIFVYRSSAEGSLSSPRGGYFSIRDIATNMTITMNADSSVTTTTNSIITNFIATVWMSSTNFSNPNTSGGGYVRSFTTTQPSVMSQIDNANYGILPGNPNPCVSYTTNIDLINLTTNIVATTNGSSLYFTPVGAGLRGVTGGDSVQRFKPAGIQIVGYPTAALTNIFLSSQLPTLFAGSTLTIPLNPVGQYNDGDTFPLWLLPSTTYSSDNTNVMSVDSLGNLHPGHGGSANVTITSGTFNKVIPITVLAPTAIRLFMSSPTNLFLGNGKADSGQAQLFADFPGASTNSAVSNINVTAYNYVTFSGDPTNLVNVSTSGLVTAVGTSGNGLFSLHATYDSLSIDANAVGHTQSFPAPGTVASFGINMWDGASLDAANFKDLSGAPGNRQAYWNNLNFTLPSAANPSNLVANPVDYHGNTLNGTTVVITGTGFSFANAVTLTTNETRILGTAQDSGLNGNGASTATAERVVVVTNVPYSVYDAYFYFQNQPGNPSRIAHVTAMETLETRWKKSPTTLSGSLDNIVPNPATGNGYVQAIPIISGGSIPNGVRPGSLANIPAGNYIKFTGLTNPIAQFRWGPDDKDSASDADSVMRTRFAALQIVKNLGVLTPTNLYMDSSSSNLIKTLLPGNPTTSLLSVFADFTDGTLGGNVSSLASYSSTDANIFSVDANGVITPGTQSGTASLIVSFKTLSITQTVTTLAPISVTVKAKPGVSYLDGANQAGSLAMLATYPGYTNVDISSFNTVTFYDASTISAGIAYVSGPPWTITPQTVGTADLAGSYLGVGYTNVGGFQVRYQYDNGLPINVLADTNNPANNSSLKHRYTFDDVPSSTVIADSVGGANGVIVSGLSGSSPLVLDGSRVNFPSNNVYQTTPYIKLPAGIISELGDVTIDIWCGMNEQKPWARFFDFGSSQKGSDAHNGGNGITSMFFTGIPGGAFNPRLAYQFPGGIANIDSTGAMPLGVEQHFTLVYSPNQGVTKMYVNGTLVNSGSPVGALQTLDDANVWIGQSQWQDPILNGWISELRIYEGAFTDADAAASEAAGANAGIIASPTISVSRSASNLVISWPLASANYTLRSNTVLNGTWYPVSATLTTNGSNVEVTVPASSGNAFFRLQKP